MTNKFASVLPPAIKDNKTRRNSLHRPSLSELTNMSCSLKNSCENLLENVEIEQDYTTVTPDDEDNNKISIKPTMKNDNVICSISTDYGGIAIDKDNVSKYRWVIERNNDYNLNFHFNSENNTPLSITPKGIKSTKLTLNSRSIKNILYDINESSISNESIPTTKAVVNYINSNIIKKNIEKMVAEYKNSETPISPKSSSDIENIDFSQTLSLSLHRPTSLPSCDISTIDTNLGKTLLIDIESTSLSFKDNNNIITLKPSIEHGLTINNTYRLKNDVGMLCYLKDKINTDNIKGCFVEFTGNYIEINDMKVIEVQIPESLNTSICGICIKDLKIEEIFVKDNIIYELPKEINDVKMHFITIQNSGVTTVRILPSLYIKDNILVPREHGYAEHSTPESNKYCIENCIPRAKVISAEVDTALVMIV